MKLLVVGAGLSGSVVAYKFAQQGHKVVILERKKHVAGHIYDKLIDGIMSHIYGPHIFHTDKEHVVKFMNQFWELNNFKNEVLCNINKKQIPIPFNFTGIDTFFPNESAAIKKILLDKYSLDSRVTIIDLLKIENPLIKKMTDFVYENIFANYTSKMWGIDAKKIDPSVLKRVPITIGYSTRYFANKFEGIPQQGYTNAIKKMLDHSNIKVLLDVNAVDVLQIKNQKIYYQNELVTCPVIYTGPIDELFGYKHGVLEYRSLDIVFKTLPVNSFQDRAVVNYPAHPTMTRISEYKKMTLSSVSDKTVLSYEYPGKFDLNSSRFHTPYYPMMSENAKKTYEKYHQDAQKIKNLSLLGRLATFKYINMDDAIDLALTKSAQLLQSQFKKSKTSLKDII